MVPVPSVPALTEKSVRTALHPAFYGIIGCVEEVLQRA
jgi:hypothetical protein